MKRGSGWMALIGLPVLAWGWQAEVPLRVEGPGVVDVALPPGLHSAASSGGLDVRVVGPEGRNRPVELYWHGEEGEVAVHLEPESMNLEGKTFIWRASVRGGGPTVFREVSVEIAAGNYVGAVSVFGLDGAWKKLAENAAVYTTGGRSRTAIAIPEGRYSAFRLEFTADQKKPVPIHAVTVRGSRTGRPVKTETVSLPWTTGQEEGEIWMRGTLPGSGLWIHSVTIQTKGRYSGRWSLQREGVVAGRKAFITEESGEARAVGDGGTVLTIPWNRKWAGRSLVVRLETGGKYFGGVDRFIAKVQLPRLAFVAESAGSYTVQSGGGETVSVLETPSEERRGGEASALLGSVIRNPRWRPEDLAARFQFKGAPFVADGYTWRSSIPLSAPGYYRILLHQRGSLEGRFEGLRLVSQGNQVPYFMDPGEKMEVSLTAQETHDPKSNKTVYRVELPMTSERWIALKIRAAGIFQREVWLERDMPEPTGSPVMAKVTWKNASPQEGELVMDLSQAPERETRFRLIVWHGDNTPIKIGGMKAVYRAPALYFLADHPGEYDLYGGHPKAAAPQYDLQLIESELMSEVPSAAALAEPQAFTDGGWLPVALRPVLQARWGFYVALALMTLGLLVVVVRLFPQVPPKS